jgi:hypothetical protein
MFQCTEVILGRRGRDGQRNAQKCLEVKHVVSRASIESCSDLKDTLGPFYRLWIATTPRDVGDEVGDTSTMGRTDKDAMQSSRPRGGSREPTGLHERPSEAGRRPWLEETEENGARMDALGILLSHSKGEDGMETGSLPYTKQNHIATAKNKNLDATTWALHTKVAYLILCGAAGCNLVNRGCCRVLVRCGTCEGGVGLDGGGGQWSMHALIDYRPSRGLPLPFPLPRPTTHPSGHS